MKTAVEFIASELLYLDNEYDMKLINKNEYQAKRKEIIEQAKEIFEEQIRIAYMEGAFEKMRHLEGKEFMMPTEYYNETFKSE
jgi:hypothetical protein